MIALKTTPEGTSEPEVFDVDAYIRSRSAFFVENAFYETEVDRRLERWRNAAHILSSYESRRDPSQAPLLRGVNSIQLYNDAGCWRILSIVWDNASEAPLPRDPVR